MAKKVKTRKTGKRRSTKRLSIKKEPVSPQKGRGRKMGPSERRDRRKKKRPEE